MNSLSNLVLLIRLMFANSRSGYINTMYNIKHNTAHNFVIMLQYNAESIKHTWTRNHCSKHKYIRKSN